MKHSPQFPSGIDNIVELQPGPPARNALAIARPHLPNRKDVGVAPPVPSAVEEPTMIDEAFAAVSQAEAMLMQLSPEQRTAIEHLTSGHTLVASATAAGVTRMTLHRWLRGDAVFTAAFNAWQKDVLATARGRLLALSDLAVTTVAKSMSRGDAKTALKLLQSVGALDRHTPGSIDPEEVRQLQNVEHQNVQNALRKAEFKAEMQI